MNANNSRINVALGKNFSGRSEYLKSKCGNDVNGIYIGEIPSNYLSGVAPTVKSELELFASRATPEIRQHIEELINQLKFNELYGSNPFQLSGGEQVLLATLSGILLQPTTLALDTLLEQLNVEWKVPLFKLIEKIHTNGTFLLSDNRIAEYKIDFTGIKLINTDQTYPHIFSRPILTDTLNNQPSDYIELKDVWFRYTRKRTILKNISMRLDPGNIYFLQGKNGAGKSTLAKILAGILKPAKGEITVNSISYNPYRIPGKLVGYSFQNPDEQLFSKTVTSEILQIKKSEPRHYTERREAYLEMFGLNRIRDVHPAELPFVMRKRVAIAASLATERPWYIIDEPTIGQDDSFLDFLYNLFKKITQEGKGVIIISHSPSFINRFQSNHLYLDNGNLIAN